MTEIDLQKRELRASFQALRNRLCSSERDAAIARRALNTDGRSFFIYLSVGAEVDTRQIIDSLLAAGKTVCVPRIVRNKMSAVRYSGGELPKGAFGIPAPICGEDMPCDVAFVPLLAADEEGYRLGYGGGFYDRYFAEHPDIKRVGLAYSFQIVKSLPRSGTDVPLHAIITEETTLIPRST